MKKSYFNADILLPDFKNVAPEKWSVVACDQFTSQPEYWQETEATVGAAPSTLKLTLPEVYLEAEDEQMRVDAIHATMQQYLTDGSMAMNSMIVESEKRFRVVDYNDVYEYSFDYSTYTQEITGYDAEGQLVSAISYVLNDVMPKAYMITGHDEIDLDTTFLEAIEKQNITLEELGLLTVDEIPSDAEFVLISSAVRPEFILQGIREETMKTIMISC